MSAGAGEEARDKYVYMHTHTHTHIHTGYIHIEHKSSCDSERVGIGCLDKAGSHLQLNNPTKRKKKKDKIDRWNWRKIKMFMALSPSGLYL